ncbi:zinc-dependent metalloprotease [Bifidobacterium sp. W8106]|uniref:zinc-dependent metalloprotease n=1 Tax=Bifidobacterium TaxID=1678 RepID=UPI0018DCBA90|nr:MULTISPECIES: zinc-dependent metalloprotease [Bifidobacterium]MBI0142294.1 zinc-dependent metalloprotease [Bifidobacterium choladohabitans]MBI0146688.1 zinc-dependent metalloprotease [Bifidobacterium sp. W8104]
MDENAIHQWLIECFGPVQGELAWSQFSQLPESIRSQMAAQGADQLPKPSEVQALIQAFTAGGLNTPADMQAQADQGPINVALAKNIALGRTRADQSDTTITAEDSDRVARVMSEANLWLDTVCAFDPAPGQTEALTRAGWIEGSIDAWVQFASPVAQAVSEALTSVISQRFQGFDQGEISGMFAGPVPIPLPDNLKDPTTLLRLLGNTSFAMQLGQAAGELAKEVRGGFDQGIPLLKNPAGALIPQNIKAYAKSLELDLDEVTRYMALKEAAHARLYAAVPWLMPRFEALIGKYARGVSIDLDAVEDQLRDAEQINPESIAGAINLSNVGIEDTPEQKEALHSLGDLLALVDGWVDCVVWNAGMAHLPHLEQLREMTRRERAVGGPAEQTFESLLGLHLHPKRLREAADLWGRITAEEGVQGRDDHWSHPDLLPSLPVKAEADEGGASTSAEGQSEHKADTPATSVDWDAELDKLLNAEETDSSADPTTPADSDVSNDQEHSDHEAPGNQKSAGNDSKDTDDGHPDQNASDKGDSDNHQD